MLKKFIGNLIIFIVFIDGAPKQLSYTLLSLLCFKHFDPYFISVSFKASSSVNASFGL